MKRNPTRWTVAVAASACLSTTVLTPRPTHAEPPPAEGHNGQNAPSEAIETRDLSKPAKVGAMTITGIVFTALGVVSASVWLAGMIGLRSAERRFHRGPTLADREAANAQGEQSEIFVWAGGISALALLGAGLPLITVGRQRDARRQREITLRAAGNRRGAGLTLEARF